MPVEDAMIDSSGFQIGLFLVVLIALVKPLGLYMAHAAEGNPPFVRVIGRPVERLIYRLAGIDPAAEMSWVTYAIALILFTSLGTLFLYALQRLQGLLPLNRQSLPAVSPDSTWNTAVSSVTNTSWQGYAGETTLSYLTQMLGITVQSFLSAASAMAVMFAVAAAVTIHAEQTFAPAPGSALLNAAGGNMEGKETRFGVASSALYATVTTSGGDGAVDAMHDSFSPIGGLVPMVLMQTGEVVFGGPGSGLFSLVIYALLAVFVAGLMIGRAPEYLRKKIDAYEMKMVAIVILATPLLALVGTAIAVLVPAGVAGLGNPGAHGFMRNPLRLLFGGKQQRQRIRRALRQYAVLQLDAGHCDVVRPLRRDRARAGDRRLAGREAQARRKPGHAAYARAAVRQRADRYGGADRFHHVSAGAGARADRGAVGDRGRAIARPGGPTCTLRSFTILYARF
jgi:K+-transporting ATPase A subunit